MVRYFDIIFIVILVSFFTLSCTNIKKSGPTIRHVYRHGYYGLSDSTQQLDEFEACYRYGFKNYGGRKQTVSEVADYLEYFVGFTIGASSVRDYHGVLNCHGSSPHPSPYEIEICSNTFPISDVTCKASDIQTAIISKRPSTSSGFGNQLFFLETCYGGLLGTFVNLASKDTLLELYSALVRDNGLVIANEGKTGTSAALSTLEIYQKGLNSILEDKTLYPTATFATLFRLIDSDIRTKYPGSKYHAYLISGGTATRYPAAYISWYYDKKY